MKRTLALGDVAADFRTGSTPPTSQTEYFNGSIPWFTPGDIGHVAKLRVSVRTITEDAVKAGKARLFDPGDLLITCIGDIGRAGIVTVPSSANQQITCVRFKPDIDTTFAYFWVLANKHRFMKLASQSVVPILNNERLSEIKITYPPLPEQKRIAALLEKADRVRRLRRYAREMSEGFLQSVFREMFGDPVRNERGWEVNRLDALCDVRDGTHDSPDFHETGYPLVTSKNLAHGRLDLTDVDYISEADFQKINARSRVTKHDMLMPMIGTIGNPVIIEIEPSFAIKNVALIRNEGAKVSFRYLRELLKSSFLDQVISKIGRGGTQKFLSLGDIRGLEIPIPPDAEVARFKAVCNRHNLILEAVLEAERQAEHLFQTLLHRAFAEG